MTIQKTLEQILARLDKIEERLLVIPNVMDIGQMIATTADREDVHELQGSVDAIYGLIEDRDRQSAIADIRSSLRAS